MGWIVSFDPGTRFTGWAEFEGNSLIECGIVKGKGLDDMLMKCVDKFGNYGGLYNLALVEIPQVYVQRKMKGDANDLIKIALVAGVIAAQFNESKFVLPRTWKGTVDKDVMCKRVENRWMNERERDLLTSKRIAKGQLNNTLDAIGVGMHYLGRHR